ARGGESGARLPRRPAQSSSCERGQRESRPGWARSLGEDIPVRRFERIERRQPASREQADSPADASADSRLQGTAGGKQPSRPRGFEPKQLEQLRARAVEL